MLDIEKGRMQSVPSPMLSDIYYTSKKIVQCEDFKAFLKPFRVPFGVLLSPVPGRPTRDP